jgi:hypothetical protein
MIIIHAVNRCFTVSGLPVLADWTSTSSCASKNGILVKTKDCLLATSTIWSATSRASGKVLLPLQPPDVLLKSGPIEGGSHSPRSASLTLTALSEIWYHAASN